MFGPPLARICSRSCATKGEEEWKEEVEEEEEEAPEVLLEVFAHRGKMGASFQESVDQRRG